MQKEQKTFCSVNSEQNEVSLTLTFKVNEIIGKGFHKPTPDMYKASEMMRHALENRMAHCQRMLTTAILPMTDKVFSQDCIYSQSAGKHFSIKAYQAMEENLESKNYIDSAMQNLLFNNQLLNKAVASLTVNSEDEKDIKEYLISILCEIAVFNEHRRS